MGMGLKVRDRVVVDMGVHMGKHGLVMGETENGYNVSLDGIGIIEFPGFWLKAEKP